jgi:hypothetical protein
MFLPGGSQIDWCTTIPRECQDLIKREIRDIQLEGDDRNKHGRAQFRIKELTNQIYTAAVTHKMSGDIVLSVLRQCLGGNLRDFFDVLRDVHGLKGRSLWMQIQLNSGEEYTQLDAIKDIFKLQHQPEGITFSKLTVLLPDLVEYFRIRL